jgi:3'(2'), 5'-bisphosphate nucleotidase
VADYAAQAIINTVLSNAFPDDPIIGEEDASDLRPSSSSTSTTNESGDALRARVVELADDILAQPPLPPDSEFDPSVGGERAEWGLGRRWGAEALLKAIDRGKYAGGRTGRALRFCVAFFTFALPFVVCTNFLFFWCVGFWTLDPIDGTKGFLRGGQYAVCLALLVDARVELGVIGCPNLPTEPSASPQSTTASTDDKDNDDDDDNEQQRAQGRGALFIAVRGQGAYQLPLHPPTSTSDVVQQPRRRLTMPHLALHELSFLESYEKAHAALDTNARVASRLGVRAQPVRMDSQAKYAALVRGDEGGGVYLRLPVAFGKNDDDGEGGYQEKIWVRLFSLSLSRISIAFR